MPYIICSAISEVCCDTPPNGACCTECEVCEGGACNLKLDGSACTGTPSFSCCSGICVDWQNDPNNCGDCGNLCLDFGFDCCSGGCYDLWNTPAHCGSCGNACAPGQLCAFQTCYTP